MHHPCWSRGFIETGLEAPQQLCQLCPHPPEEPVLLPVPTSSLGTSRKGTGNCKGAVATTVSMHQASLFTLNPHSVFSTACSVPGLGLFLRDPALLPAGSTYGLKPCRVIVNGAGDGSQGVAQWAWEDQKPPREEMLVQKHRGEGDGEAPSGRAPVLDGPLQLSWGRSASQACAWVWLLGLVTAPPSWSCSLTSWVLASLPVPTEPKLLHSFPELDLPHPLALCPEDASAMPLLLLTQHVQPGDLQHPQPGQACQTQGQTCQRSPCRGDTRWCGCRWDLSASPVAGSCLVPRSEPGK